MIQLTTSRVVRKVRLLSVVGAVGLLLIGGGLLDHHIKLAALREAAQADTQTRRLQTLEDRVEAVEAFQASEQLRAVPVSQADFLALQRSTDTRLTALDVALTDAIAVDALPKLQDEVDGLKASLKEAQATAARQQPARRAAPKPPVPVAPPFQTIGLELRGGERFLAVTPLAVQSLEHTQLLRVGDAFEGWQLEDIEQQVAVFRVNNQVRRLAVP